MVARLCMDHPGGATVGRSNPLQICMAPATAGVAPMENRSEGEICVALSGTWVEIALLFPQDESGEQRDPYQQWGHLLPFIVQLALHRLGRMPGSPSPDFSYPSGESLRTSTATASRLIPAPDGMYTAVHHYLRFLLLRRIRPRRRCVPHPRRIRPRRWCVPLLFQAPKAD